MFEDELPESDSSDEDFVPTGAGGSDLSEEESDNAVDEDQNDDATVTTKRKRASKTKSTKSKRKKKTTSDDEPPDEVEIEEKKPTQVSAEEKKKHADALWADFMKDCGPTAKKQPEQTRTSNKSTIKTQPIKTQINDDSTQESKLHSVEDRLTSDLSNGTNCDISTSATSIESSSSDKVVEVYEFAGEKVVVEKKVDPNKKLSRGGSGGVAAILNQINKKGKLSTLEKSKLDWEGFKDKEGINEELSAHNKGKNGYLEKQDFLERADLRQFELEKEMRAHNRSKRL